MPPITLPSLPHASTTDVLFGKPAKRRRVRKKSLNHPKSLRKALAALKIAQNQPPPGPLVPLHTRAELQARDATVEVYYVEVAVGETGKVLSAVKSIQAQQSPPVNLRHLRRVVNHDSVLPLTKQDESRKSNESRVVGKRFNELRGGGPSEQDLTVNDAGNASRKSSKSLSKGRPEPSSKLNALVLLCPISYMGLDALEALIFKTESETPKTGRKRQPQIRTALVPQHPQSSLLEAARLSVELWPTIYNPNTLYGPRPALLSAAEEEMLPDARRYLDLAHAVASETRRKEGVSSGTVVVERIDGIARIVATAGDRRWLTAPRRCGNGDPSGHSVMRALAFIAYKRRLIAEQPPKHPGPARPAASRLELPYLEDMGNLVANGYLALNLEVYMTHEPCIMCAMALVHSRIGRAVFEHRMPKTGALTAGIDSHTKSEGHGLFWRDPLNWKFLAWEWNHDSNRPPINSIGKDVHA